jgi:GntR family transcriptional regulator
MKTSLLDHDGPLPLYHQIKEILIKRIQEKKWRPGDLIPTEQELIDEFSVSRTTIRQAITALAQDGLLEKRQGKGTTVKSHQLVGTLGRLTGFAEEVLEEGYLPYSKLIRCEFHDHLYTEKKKLKLPEQEKVLVIERIRFADDEPIALERTCWSKETGDILQQHDLNGAKFYQVLEEHNIYLKKADEKISAANATPYEADLLGISGGQALLEMTRLSYGMDDRPLEYTRTKYRSDRYHYHVELKR